VAWDTDSAAYSDRFYTGHHTSTVVADDGRKVAVAHNVFTLTHQGLLAQVRTFSAARHYALEFARLNFLRKFSAADPAWAALDDFILESIPEDERYW
jgi:hypothetical protein